MINKRLVTQNLETGKWSYVEVSEGNSIFDGVRTTCVNVLGDKEFDSKEEATEYSKGFIDGSYIWVDKHEKKSFRLKKARLTYFKRIHHINKQLLDLRFETAQKAQCTTTIPKDEWGVHETHCCFEHGCKYRNEQCPVELGIVKQRYQCESCYDDESEYKQELERLK